MAPAPEWVTGSGRVLRLVRDVAARTGGISRVVAVEAIGPPTADVPVLEGTRLALKLARVVSVDTAAALGREAELLQGMSRTLIASPCPRAYDVVGPEPVTGIVMEWCPTDLEAWWIDHIRDQDAFRLLSLALADVCHAVGQFQAHFRAAEHMTATHGDIKPRNVLRAEDGRWLLVDLGAARFRPMDQHGWSATRVVIGTQSYLAPEVLFNARKPFPSAIDVWSIGCTFLVLLQLRAMLLRGLALPKGVTANRVFRTRRTEEVLEVFERARDRFANRLIEVAWFPQPDRLPEHDRLTVQQGLRGAFGPGLNSREDALASSVVRVLERALHIDPAARFADGAEMALAFEGLARRWDDLSDQRKMHSMVEAAEPARPPEPKSTQLRAQRGSGLFLPLQTTEDEGPTTEMDAQRAPDERVATAVPTSENWTDAEATDDPSTPVDASLISEHTDVTYTPVGSNSEAPVEVDPGHTAVRYQGLPVAPAPPEPSAFVNPAVDTGTRLPNAHAAVVQELAGEVAQLRAEARRLRSRGWMLPALVVMAVLWLMTLGMLATSVVLWRRAVRMQAHPTTEASSTALPSSHAAGGPSRVQPAPAALPSQPHSSSPQPVATGEGSSVAEAHDSTTPRSTVSSGDLSHPAPPADSTNGAPDPTAEPSIADEPEVAMPTGGPSDLAPDRGRVDVSGADNYLVGPIGRVATGDLQPARYELWAEIDPGSGSYAHVDTFDLLAGQVILVRCGFGHCRRVQ